MKSPQGNVRMADSQPSPLLLATIRTIDTFTDLTGSIFAWMSVPLVAAVAYEVFARYLFNSPTVWSFDVTYMLYGALFMLGAAYALHKGAHIRTDFFWDSFSPRTRGWIDSVSYILFFFPSFALLAILSWHEAEYAFRINETSDQTPWRPILWPFKAIIPAACILLMIQGVSELLKSLYMARTGVELEHKEKVEV
jgi:TRAP-type mannitol/chloroaromatic compound transport system permease small subunit